MVLWLGYALDVSGNGTPTTLFIWLTLGVNLALWSALGLVRLVDDGVRTLASARRRRRAVRHRSRLAVGSGARRARAGARAALVGPGDDGLVRVDLLDRSEPPAVPDDEAADDLDALAERVTIAVLMPAHNEELVIADAIASAKRLFDDRDIYLVSDASIDATADIAREAGINVLDLYPNKGKAGALEAAIEHFGLTDRYDGVLILDADSELDVNYLRRARRMMAEDPKIAAIAGYAVTQWRPKERSWIGRMITAYRDQVYLTLQLLSRFGMTWRWISAAFIVPGFASIYRSSALRHIDINPEGLVIEDYNMTFELQHKRLGRIGFHPGIKAYSQDPHNLRDYISQVRRWQLGFYQTIRRHGIWPSVFCFVLIVWVVEVLFVAVALFAVLVLAVFLALPLINDGWVLQWQPYAVEYQRVSASFSLPLILVGLVAPGYFVTCVIAACRRRPSYLFYGVFFLFFRIIDAFIMLRTIPQGWTQVSSGQWRPPSRS
nr:glycosyltransferase family 2 protein [Allonocardiopsis opalescens]